MFWTGSAGGTPGIWKSTDGGETWNRRASLDPDTSAPAPVSLLKPIDNDVILVASYDGTNGVVYRSTNSCFSYSSRAAAGKAQIVSLSVSPDFAVDGTVLAGNAEGWVYISTDNGTTFEPVPRDAVIAPLSDSIGVAFDSAFAANRIIYAASATADTGIFRFVMGASPRWERIDTALASGSVLNALAVSRRGTLYASNFKTGQGIERSLDPTSLRGPVFEAVSSGLADDTTLQGIWITGDTVWSIDTSNARVVALRDSLVAAVIPTSPPDKAVGLGSLSNHLANNVRLEWAPVSGVLSYEWQTDTDDSFSSVPNGLQGTTTATTVRLPALDPNTAYYWRVRTSTPVLGAWSDVRSFKTTLDMEPAPLRLESPKPGDSGVPVRPVFQWAPIVQADGYELLVSRDTTFANPIVARQADNALATTSWESNVALDYATTYYWKVRAVTASTRTAWSGTATFTTVPAPSSVPSPAPALSAPAVKPPSAAGVDQPRDGVPQPLLYQDRIAASPSPPPVLMMPYPEIPAWVKWIILGQIATTLALIVALVVIVLGLRKRSV